MFGVQKQTRSLPTSLAPIVEEMELRQPAVVTRALLEQIAAQTGVELRAEVLAERLVRLGWLLPVRTRGAWEFSPAARAGRFSSGDPWIELRALLAQQPDTPVAIAFESAVWELGHSSHQPRSPVLAHHPSWRPLRSLGGRTVAFKWRLPGRQIRELPVWAEATVLVAAASRPAAQGNWANADEWLPNAFKAARHEDVLAEAQAHTASTLARLGYLAERAGEEELADEIEELLPARLPVTFLGPRDRTDRWSRRWRVYDGLLPLP